MTPAARVQAAIELLDAVIAAAKDNGPPADRLIADGFRARRYAGSKDRRAIRDLVYGAIRACGPVPANGRAAMLRLAEENPAILPLFDGSAYGPATVSDGEIAASDGLAPDWLQNALIASDVAGSDALALLERAPLDVRVNSLKAQRSEIQLAEPGEALVTDQGLRFPSGTQIEQWDVYREGKVEIQDLGSQIACLAVDAQPGEVVIDLCAGGGGKTLALAAAMGNRGTLIASDTDRQRLSQLAPRAERAGAMISETLLLNPGKELEGLSDWAGKADAVLVDAPCSGTGTWRRNPEGRWRLTERQLERYVETQQHLMQVAAKLVKPGGRLVYVTCSLLDAEGRFQIDRFLEGHENWVAELPDVPAGSPRGKGLRLTPHHDGTDGFFVARLRHIC